MQHIPQQYLGGNLSQSLYNWNNSEMNDPNPIQPLTTMDNPLSRGWSVSWRQYAPAWNVTNMNPTNTPPGETPQLSQMSAFINQSRLSQFYQNNPYQTLMFSTKFGLPTMGGPPNQDSQPGAFPGNTIKKPLT